MNFELQFLKSGKALCGKVFPNFVATFNWLVNFANNMKGDADVDDTQGHIKIDRSDPAHPVIRYVTPDTSADGGGSGGDETPEDEETDAVVTSANGATGDVSVIGGKGIEVSTDGQTIKVSWNKDKEDEDEDPNSGASDNGESPCDHDASGSAGGVAAGGSGDGSGASDDDFGGGVSAGGDSHSGDDDCNCD